MDQKKAIITGGEIGMVLAEEGYDITFSYYPNTHNVDEAIETTLLLPRERSAKGIPFSANPSSRLRQRHSLKKPSGAWAGWTCWSTTQA